MKRIFVGITLVLAVLAFCAVTGHTGTVTDKQRADLLAQVDIREIHADLDRNGIFDDLEAALAGGPADAVRDVIVRFKSGRESASAPFAERITRVLKADNSVVARLTWSEIRQLASSGDIESIEENVIEHADRDTSQASFGVTKARLDFGLTGNMDGDANVFSSNDMVIALVDSGADGNHPSFANNKIIAFKDLVNGRTQPYDDNGHGTHTASIAAGGLTDGTGGVAPGAALVMVKTLDAAGSGPTDRTAASIDWIIENRVALHIRVISISLGTGRSDGTDAHSRAVERAVAAGLVVCNAAGNTGPSPYTIGTGAAAPNTITVGNFYDTGKLGFALYVTSGRGPTLDNRAKPDVCGPGVNILAAAANTGGLVRNTGTSMAAPFVAGVAALMLQANSNLTPADVKAIMKSTAVPWGPPYNYGTTSNFAGVGGNTQAGAGRLDAYEAIARAANRTGTPPVGPDHLSGGGFLTGLGAAQTWEIPVDSTAFPIAITMLLDDLNTDFDIFLFAPNGANVALSALTNARQETIVFNPASSGTGRYQLVVLSWIGSGLYWLDVSAATSLK